MEAWDRKNGSAAFHGGVFGMTMVAPPSTAALLA